ncbi:hypothetical protein ABB37_03884 [Leptomonas pyrrhocoris]|uniref:Uncharacterized protein n=1 Tax=Leptomonas pyrrhocoris TaxID=157538 RepID=A0A0M9G3Q8_LEPPY|nr:hypothetical protein ABB37_03884 [Leptomonas pyrrhocoris]KPA81539.1 hypothetical protein ABB37_03884 [Leptomonas pyrrhocoris]|eukprot:XP_015659978.1 hypothetical protein ABB37_03884 [Leptomonas pyrrhocoris]
MSSSSSVPVDFIDPYVLEFALNFKWLLRYATQHLDPMVEVQYPTFVADVVNMERVLAQLTFERSCALNNMPFGALRLSRDMVLYLLVCDHLLGGCPPTMHPFLQQAYSSSRDNAQTQGGGPSSSHALQREAVIRSRRPATHADFNESFPSASDDDAEGAEGRGGVVTAAVAEPATRALDGRQLGTLDSAVAQMSTSETTGAEGTAAQAALLLLRWLFVEGVLSEDELAATLNLDRVGDSASDVRSGNSNQSEDSRAFQRHQRLAARLAELIPFYLGAHVLISRSILLQYSATLLTADGVMQHVRRLEAPLETKSKYARYSVVYPPSSVEGALLEWFQAVMDSAQQQIRDNAVSSARLTSCIPLQSFIEHGPFCQDVLDPSERDFFRLVQCGECVCIALWFYCPEALPLTELSHALRDAEAFVSSPPPEAAHFSRGEAADLVQRHRSLCHWTAIIAASRYLGVVPLLSPEEVVSFGRTALPLHLFVLIQQLFAVLATNAEEDVRVSADTAWWRQMGTSDAYTKVMAAKEMTRQRNPNYDEDTHTGATSSTLPGAQHVLRQSMRDSFPPEAFSHLRESGQEGEEEKVEEEVVVGSPNAATSAALEHVPEDPDIMEAVNRQPTHDETVSARLGRAQTLALPPTTAAVPNVLSLIRNSTPLPKERVSVEDFTATLAAEAVPGERNMGRNSNTNTNSCGSSSSAASTHFTVEFAHTQRGDTEGSDARMGTMEAAASVLRPMVRRRAKESPVTTGEMRSYSGTTFTSIDTEHPVATETYEKASDVLSGSVRKVEFAVHVVDTYVRTPDDVPLTVDEVARSTEILGDDIEDGPLKKPPWNADEIPSVSAAGPQGVPYEAASVLSSEHRSPRTGHAVESLATKKTASVAPVPDDVDTNLMSRVEPRPLLEDKQLLSPPLSGPREDSDKTRSPFVNDPQTVAAFNVDSQSNASSLTYSADFVVESGPPDASESPMNEVVVAVDTSASFSALASRNQVTDDDIMVSASPLVPLGDEAHDGEVQTASSPLNGSIQETRNKVSVPFPDSAVVIKKFTAMADDADTAESSISDNNRSSNNDDTAPSPASVKAIEKDGSPSRPSRLLSTPSLSSVESDAADSPESSAHSEATTRGNDDVPNVSPLALLAAPTHPVAATATPAGHSHSVTHDSEARSTPTGTAAPVSAHSRSVTDIAVEYDSTFSALRDKATSGIRESFPTPTEREEANRLRSRLVETTSDTSADVPVVSQQTPVPGHVPEASVQDSVCQPGALSPSPIQPERELQLLRSELLPADPLLRETALSHHTLSDDDKSNVEGLSPLTPALTQSVSEVYGSDYASLLEGVASSYGSLPQGHRPRHWAEESWFSSVSHPNRQSIQSAAGSMLSDGSPYTSTRVRELLHRLGSTAVANLDDKDNVELRGALARQQELVQQLTAALQERARSREDARGFAPPLRPRDRRRQVHLRSPSEDLRRGSSSVERQRSGSRSLLTDVQRRHGGSAAENLRQRSLSGMTVESQATPTRSLQTDVGAQLAETDVSSLLADVLIPAKSVSPTRATRQ